MHNPSAITLPTKNVQFLPMPHSPIPDPNVQFLPMPHSPIPDPNVQFLSMPHSPIRNSNAQFLPTLHVQLKCAQVYAPGYEARFYACLERCRAAPARL
jgi:hypothetical protein